MTIKHVQNPVTNENLTIVEGEVEGVYFKEIDGGADKYGNTHRGSVKIDGDYVNNINLKVKEGYDPEIRFNAGSRAAPDWQSVHVGDVLKLVVTENEYNGKTYYNGKVSQIVLVSKGAGVAKHASSAQEGPRRRATLQKRIILLSLLVMPAQQLIISFVLKILILTKMCLQKQSRSLWLTLTVSVRNMPQHIPILMSLKWV